MKLFLLFLLLIFQVEVLLGRSMYDRFKKGMYDRFKKFDALDRDFLENQPKITLNERAIGYMDFDDINNDRIRYIDKEQELFIFMKMLFDDFIKSEIAGMDDLNANKSRV